MSPASASSGAVAPGFSRTLAIDPLFPPREPRRLCAELESGNIILLARSPIVIPDEDRELLLDNPVIPSEVWAEDLFSIARFCPMNPSSPEL